MKFDLSRSVIPYMLTLFCFGLCYAAEVNSVEKTNVASLEQQKVNDSNESALPATSQPIIIWHWSSYYDDLEPLRLALSTGLITHVSIGMMSRRDSDYTKDLKVLSAIKMVKNSGAKLIWLHWLWPAYHIEQSRPEDLFDPNFYIQEIRFIRAEADKIGADFVAFDTEPYGNTPMFAYKKKEIILEAKDLQRLKATIKEVIDTVGKVDFILPEGWPGNLPPHDIIAELGTNRISSGVSYFNYKRIKSVKVPYEIFGVYVNTTRENKGYPELPFFLVSDIFDNSYLWSNKKGIFLYPRERNAEAVARELVKYARSLPAVKARQESATRN